MAATHLTLEESAERLGISPEEFKKRLKTDPSFKILVPIRDGSSLRFKAAGIDELARQLGAASDPELPLGPLDESVPPDSDDFKVPTSAAKGDKKRKDEPLSLAGGDEEIFSLTSEESKGPVKKKGDSDARLDPAKAKRASSGKDDESVVPTEELAIDFGGQGSAVIKGGSSSKLSAPKSSGKISSGKLTASDSSKSLPNPAGGDSSEFELSLDADSDDFELKLNTESSDEVALGAVPKEPAPGAKRGGSGINLRDPADSGISLEKGKAKSADQPAAAKPESDPDVDFELTLDSSSSASAVKLSDMKGKKDPESDSEFELTLDDSGGSNIEHAALAPEQAADKGDIFETDFEIPPMEGADSGSEAVALESDTDLEKSDVEVAEDTSGSEVVLLEDEEAQAARAKGRPRKAAEADVDLADVEAEEDESVSRALKGVKDRRRDEEEEEEEEEAAVSAGAGRPVEWGWMPGTFLAFAFPIMIIGGILAYQLLETTWGYQQPRKPTAPLVGFFAKTFDMELRDQ
jgi:hypothetical protein